VTLLTVVGISAAPHPLKEEIMEVYELEVIVRKSESDIVIQLQLQDLLSLVNRSFNAGYIEGKERKDA